MQSKTSCSETSLFRRCLKRYWPLTFVFFLILIFSTAFPLASSLSRLARMQHPTADMLRSYALEDLCGHAQSAMVLAFFFALAAAMAVFEHTYSTKLTGLFASLPVKREKLFGQHWMAGFWMLLAPGIVAALAVLAVEAVYGAAELKGALIWFGVYALSCLAFYGIAVFCTMLTGHVLVIPALYLLVNFAGSALSLLLDGLVSAYCYGVTGGVAGLEWLHTLSPLVRLVTQLHSRSAAEGVVTGLTGWGWAIGYAIVGLLLSVCAMLLFKRRQNECAQETTAFPVLKPILKYIVTAFFALGFPFIVMFFLGGFSFYGGGADGVRFFPVHLLLTLVGAVIGYFFSEMIIRKSVRAFSGKGLGKALLVGLLGCALVCAFRFDAFGTARRVPEAESVQRLELRVQDNEYTLTDPEAIAAVQDLHREILAHRNESEKLLLAGESSSYLFLNYALQNGTVLQRAYAIPQGELSDLAEATINAPAVLAGLREVNPPVPVDAAHLEECRICYYAEDAGCYADYVLEGDEAVAFYEEVIRPDVLAGNYGQVKLAWFWDGDSYSRTHYNVDITFALNLDEWPAGDYGSNHLRYVPTPDTTHTNAWLEAHGIPLTLLADADY